MNFAARLERQPLLHALIQTNKRDVPWTVALRNTAAIVLPLIIGVWLGHLAIGLGIGTGALVTMFADQPGPYRLRVRRLLLAALAAGVAAFAGSVLGQWPVALICAAAIWSFVAALLAAIGPHATRAGLISMILLIIMGSEPHAPAQAAPIVLLIFSGGLLQAVVAIMAWPLQRYRPERLALATAFTNLADFARVDVAHHGTIALPASLNDLQTSLYGTGRARGRAVEAFRVLAELAERIRLELFALAHQEAESDRPVMRDAIAQARSAAAGVLVAITAALDQAAPPQAEAALAAYARAAQTVDASSAAPANPVAARIAALGGQLRAAVRNVDTAGSGGELRAQRAEVRLPRALQPANPFAILRANLRLSSPACRHALRCGTCIAIALILSRVLPLSRGYWLPMTVAIVLRPDFGATWRVGLLRTAGTLGGLLVITAVLHFIGFGNTGIELLLMATLCFAYRELATVHYGIAVVCLTGLVVILLGFYGIPPETAVHARAIDTALGSALALIAYFVWPTWERGRERAVLARLLDAYADYLNATLHGDAHALHSTRIDARAARSNAQASLDRLRAEPASRANLPRAEALVAQANRLVRIAMELEAARGDRAAIDDPTLAEFARACDGALREAAAALRESRAPRDPHPLRLLQQAFEALPMHADDAFANTVRQASDRIVDAIDSLLHVLAQPRTEAL